MASYAELYDLRSNSALRNKIAVAVAKKAQLLIDSANPSNAQITWANSALTSPTAKAETLLTYLLAANSAASVGQIQGVADADVQAAVNAAVDKLIAGGA